MHFVINDRLPMVITVYDADSAGLTRSGRPAKFARSAEPNLDQNLQTHV